MQSYLWTSFDIKQRDLLAKEAREKVSPFDLLEINGEENGGIEAVRELFQFLSRKPTQGGLNLGLILEAHQLSIEAQNALLKTLEEPPEYCNLILIAPSPGHLTPTIVSRCLVREETGEIETGEVDWELVLRVLTAKDGARLNLIEGLDLNSWLKSWEGILHAKIARSEASEVIKQLTLKEIRTYLKALMQGMKMQEDHVNAKLLTYNLALLAPKLGS